MLLYREQNDVLDRGYRELAKRNLGKVMGAFGNSPVPGGRCFGEAVYGGDLTKFKDRWDWIQKDMLRPWNAMSPDERKQYVNGPLGTIPEAPPYRFSFNIDDLQRKSERKVLDLTPEQLEVLLQHLLHGPHK